MSKYFYLPLEQVGAVYKQKEILSVDEATFFDSENYSKIIEKYFRRKKGIVSLETGRFGTSIYYPRTKEYDICFCLVDSEYYPQHSVKILIDQEQKQAYLEHLIFNCKFSEGIVPKQSINIESFFVSPRIVEKTEKKELLFSRHIFSDNCLIIGQAGSGKTTILKKLTLELAQESISDKNEIERIPVYIQLRNLNNSNDSFENYIKNIVSNINDTTIKADDNIINSGKVILLLDGVDEIQYKVFQNFTHEFQNFRKKYPLTTFIITSRPHTQFSQLDDFKQFEIQSFNIDQIRELTYKRFSQDDWRRFISILRNSPETISILGNPLLLTMAHFLYDYNEIIPTNRGLLMRELTDVLISKWDFNRNVKREYRDLKPSISLIYNLFGTISLECNKKQKASFDATEILPKAKNFKSSDELNSFLSYLELSTGLIKSTNKRSWSFTHKFYQDYFCSNYLIEGVQSINKYIFTNKNWQNISSIISGLSSEPDYILNNIFEKNIKNTTVKIENELQLLNESLIIGESEVKKIFKNLDSFLLTIELKHNLRKSDIKLSESELKIIGPKGKIIIDPLKDVFHELFKVRFTNYKKYIVKELNVARSSILRHLKQFMIRNGNIESFLGNEMTVFTLREESPEIQD